MAIGQDLEEEMQLFHWVSDVGLVVNMNATAANFLMDVLFVLLAGYISAIVGHALNLRRKLAVAQGSKQIVPLGRVGVVEMAKEWMTMGMSDCNHRMYAAVFVLAVFLALARSAGDWCLTFGKYEMGKVSTGRLYDLAQSRSDMVFQRSAEFRGTKLRKQTELQILSNSVVDDLHLYDRALRLAVEFYDVPDESFLEDKIEYSSLYLGVGTKEPKPKDGPMINVKWREADWLKQDLSKLVVNVTIGAQSNHSVQYYRHEYEVRANLFADRGFDDPSECYTEAVSALSDYTIFFAGCRKIRSDSLHSYIAVFSLCLEKFVDGHWMYFNCIRLPGQEILAEFEESVEAGVLAPLPLPVMASFAVMAAAGREPDRGYLASIIRIFLATRLFGAEWEPVDVREGVIRPELRHSLLVILALQVFLVISITIWVLMYYGYVMRVDHFVAVAHMPSYSFQWALKAHNEKLQEWSSSIPKPFKYKVKPSFGVVWMEGEHDYIGITAQPQTSRNKSFGNYTTNTPSKRHPQ